MTDTDAGRRREWKVHGRQLLWPGALALVVIAASVALWQSLAVSEQRALVALSDAQARAAETGVQQAFQQRVRALERMAARWAAAGGTPEELWFADARNYVRDFDLQAMEWVDPEGIVRWVEPLEGNRSALGLDVGLEQRRAEAHRRAVETGEVAASRKVTLVQGGPGFLVFVPIRRGGEHLGCLLAVIRFDALLNGTVVADSSTAQDFGFTVHDGADVLFDRSARGAERPPTSSPWEVELAGVTWGGTATPGARILDQHLTALPESALLIGVLLAISLGSAALLASRSGEHARNLERAHARLRASERGQRLVKYMTDHAPDAIFILDDQGRIVDANNSACRRLEYTRQELIGMSVSDINPHLPREAWAHHWEEIKRKGHLVFESEHVSKSGRILPVEIVRGYIRFEDVDVCCAYVRDLAERREAESELRLLGQAVEQSLDGIFVSDNDNRLRFANNAFLRMHGFELDEVIGQPLSMLYAPAVYDELIAGALEQLWKQGSFQGEVDHLRKNGSSLPMFLTLTILRDAGGEPVGFVGIASDITEERLDAQQRAALEEQLRHAQKLEAIGTLAGGVAHDFSNILTAILGYTRHARAQLESGGELGDILDRIDRTVDHGTGVTRSLLTFARQSRLERSAFDLSAKVEDTLDLLRHLIPASIDVDGARSAGVWVRGDATQIQQVLLNLAINARDAMPLGGILRVGVRRQDQEALLTVEDTGCGMQPEEIERIFEPFYSTKERGKGTGLGLAVVHGIVADHEGTVHVSSTPDVGTRFEIRLPLAPAEPAETSGDAPAETASAGAGALLLVEDDPHVHDALRFGLRGQGFEVISAHDGEEALERFRGDPRRVRAVLLDLDLPKLDGLSCLKRMRAIRPDLPAVILTGNIATSEAELGEPLLRKPFLVEELLERIAHLREAHSAAPTG